MEATTERLNDLVAGTNPEARLVNAVWKGDVARVRECLSCHPDLDINHQPPGWKVSVLGVSSVAITWNPEIVRLLMSHPQIEATKSWWHSPLHSAMVTDDVRMMMFLLQHPKIPITHEDGDFFHNACHSGNHRAVELILTLRFQDVDFEKRWPTLRGDQQFMCTPLEAARLKRNGFVAQSIEAYLCRPTISRAVWSLAYRLPRPMAAHLFVLSVFFSDGYFATRLRPRASRISGGHTQKRESARRFFHLASRLPMELQMILALRAFGLAGSYIPVSTTQTMCYIVAHNIEETRSCFHRPTCTDPVF
jgi:hypothetical protein